MAAAEYYNPSGQQQNLAPPQPAQPFQGNVNPPYPLSDAPPPYSEFPPQPRPHSQPPPQQRPPQPNDAYRPPPPSNGYQQYPPEKSNGHPPSQVHNMYRPSDFTGPSNQPYQQQYQQPPPQGYAPLAGTPAMQQVYGNGNSHPAAGRRTSSTPVVRPSRRDESRSRSRSRSRSGGRHRKHHHNRPQVQRKKSSGVNTFLGAGGGALIGDAIFPGLGTLGGAILGGLGGHEYGKRDKRPHSNPARTHNRSYSNDGREYYQDDYRRGRK